MSLPAAGWFPDPQDGTRLRWWNGHVWGDETRAAPGRTAAVAPIAAAAPAGPAFSVRTQPTTEARTWAYGTTVRRFCLATALAMVFAVASIVYDTWGALSVLGVVFGLIGIVRPRGTGGWRVVGRSLASSAVVLSFATGIIAANAVMNWF